MRKANLFPVLVAVIAATDFVLGWCNPSPVSAQAADTYGMSSRSAAMAGAVTADVEDWSANYYNPAGLIRSKELRFGVGWFGASADLSLNGLSQNVDPVHGLVAGLVVPGRILGLNFAFGLALHLPDAQLSRSRSLPRSVPRWEFYANRAQRTQVGANIALELFPWLRVAGGMSFQSTSAALLDARGTLNIITPDDSEIRHAAGIDLQTIRYPTIGLQIDPMPELSIGLVYRGEASLQSKLIANVNASLESGIAEPFPLTFYLLTDSVGAFIPQQASLSVSVHPTQDFRVNAELTYVNWSSYISPHGRTDVQLSAEIPPALQDMVRIPANIAGTEQQPANFSDRFVPRLAAEGTLYRTETLWTRLRGGALYEASPVPEQVGLGNLMDSDRLALSLGAGIVFNDLKPLIDGHLTIDAHFQYSHIFNRTMRKASLVDSTGDYTGGGHIINAGLSMEVAFR